MIKYISLQLLKLFGWQLETILPLEKKYIIIGAPHTSNWDFPLALLALHAMGLKFSWVGKHTLFRFPLGRLFRALGGIPVDRTVRQGFIKDMVELFAASEERILAMAPEGTRSRTEYWKTGFYSLAVAASVPIAFGYLDYRSKTIGVGETLYPSGNLVEDFQTIQRFYNGRTGKYPEKQGPVQLRKKEIQRYYAGE